MDIYEPDESGCWYQIVYFPCSAPIFVIVSMCRSFISSQTWLRINAPFPCLPRRQSLRRVPPDSPLAKWRRVVIIRAHF